MTLLYHALRAIDLLAGAVVLYFFYLEMESASMTASDARLIALVLLVVALAVFGGAQLLRARARLLLANLLLLTLAVPATLLAALLVELTVHPIAFR